MRTDRAAQLIRRARLDIGMSRDDLARSAYVQSAVISAYESGRAHPSPESLERILRAARLRPSIPLTLYADAIREAAERFLCRRRADGRPDRRRALLARP
ncbi:MULTISPECIES: helix-turn-helix domain-containing protein [unclassified Curtobacterium]|uniref:helix-turn-helix domain-containing protein n=1 Tax=unclassified Curtobacterium TaxID=257496 RepID=UPI0035A95735